MKCRECSSCKLGYFKSRPTEYVCIGVKHPFVIKDINVECTEYEEKRNLHIDEFRMTSEDIKEYKRNAIDLLRKNGQYATAKAVEEAFDLMFMVESFNNIGCTSFRMTTDELKKLGVE